MYSINTITISGRLGQDVEVQQVGDRKLAKFSIGNPISNKVKGEWVSSTQWFNVQAWGKLAEIAEKDLKKGSAVVVTGRFMTQEYEGKKYTHILADAIYSISDKATYKDNGAVKKEKTDDVEPIYSNEDDLPF